MSSMLKAATDPKGVSPSMQTPKPNPKVLGRYFLKQKGKTTSIEVVQVQSSNIQTMAYDHKSLLLTITFKNAQGSSTYTYYQVPATVFNAAKSASSVGRFVYYGIRKRFYYKRIS